MAASMLGAEFEREDQNPLERAMRWVQLVLVENDPGQSDPQWWLAFMKRVHADRACLSAGGCVAYYPTRIPFHHQSAWMKEGTDPFGELVEGCRNLNMTIVARTDPHSIRDDAAKAHPEWVAVDSASKPCAFAEPSRLRLGEMARGSVVRRKLTLRGSRPLKNLIALETPEWMSVTVTRRSPTVCVLNCIARPITQGVFARKIRLRVQTDHSFDLAIPVNGLAL